MTMKLCLTLEHRFFQTPDKGVWTITQCPYEFFREYLEVFDSVRVIARVFPVSQAEPNFLPVEGPGVEFYAMPSYKAPLGFLRSLLRSASGQGKLFPTEAQLYCGSMAKLRTR